MKREGTRQSDIRLATLVIAGLAATLAFMWSLPAPAFFAVATPCLFITLFVSIGELRARRAARGVDTSAVPYRPAIALGFLLVVAFEFAYRAGTELAG